MMLLSHLQLTSAQVIAQVQILSAFHLLASCLLSNFVRLLYRKGHAKPDSVLYLKPKYCLHFNLKS